MSVKTYQEFINDFYDSRPGMQRLHASKSSFLKHYMNQYGVSDYLFTVEGQSLSSAGTLELALYFLFQQRGCPDKLSEWFKTITEKYSVTFEPGMSCWDGDTWRVIRDHIQQSPFHQY